MYPTMIITPKSLHTQVTHDSFREGTSREDWIYCAILNKSQMKETRTEVKGRTESEIKLRCAEGGQLQENLVGSGRVLGEAQTKSLGNCSLKWYVTTDNNVSD